MKNFLKDIYYKIVSWVSYFTEAYHFFHTYRKHNSSFFTNKSQNKLQYTLLRESHIIEKGMSLRNPRNGFGLEKVYKLLKKIDKYITLYNDIDSVFIINSLSTINNYIEYTKERGSNVDTNFHTKEKGSNVNTNFHTKERSSKVNTKEKNSNISSKEKNYNIDNISNLFENIINKNKITGVQPIGGIIAIKHREIKEKAKGNFEDLLNSRHSIRYFKQEEVSKELIDEALRLAQKTPSACNRQGWLTHIYFDKKSHDLLKWQGGSRGFEEEVNCAILVTANRNAFHYKEPFQAYVDGGMYAMNLVNSLHYLGLGAITLSCGFLHGKLKELKVFDIPKNEVPIVIIGVGVPEDEYNVASSLRKAINETNRYHQ